MKTKMKNRLLVSLLCASVGAVSLSFAVANLNVASADENVLTMSMTDAASIRYDAPTGIRFETTYSASDFSAYENYAFGTLVIPSDLLDGKLTHETENVQDIRKLVWYEGQNGSTENKKVMRSVLTEIPDTFYGRELSARSYYFDGTDYVYSDITVERSVARTASLLLSQGKTDNHEDDLNAYVDAVSQGLTASVENGTTFDMVVGGKETITATTNPANYAVVWTSSDPSVASVSNGSITAKANGQTTITVAFGTEYSYSYTVNVADYVQRDGSEIVYTVENPTVGNYSLTTETVAGRTGVYSYTNNGGAEWTQKLNVKEAGHLNSHDGNAKKASYAQFKKKGYNYVSFDICLASSSYATVAAMGEGVNTFLGDKLTAGASITDNNSNISIYTAEGMAVSYVLADVWYTVVVDYSEISTSDYYSTDRIKGYCRIEIGGIKGTIYLDNVRYYATDVWTKYTVADYVQRDGSEFVIAAPFDNATGTYGKATAEECATVNRTNVYKYTSKVSNWGDKISIKEANHLGTKVNASKTAARNNMKGKGYNYITFDMYLASGGVVLNVPDEAATSSSGQLQCKFSTTYMSNGSSYIQVYKDGVVSTSFAAGAWYTVIIEYSFDASGDYAGIDIGSLKADTVVYFDNVRYYNEANKAYGLEGWEPSSLTVSLYDTSNSVYGFTYNMKNRPVDPVIFVREANTTEEWVAYNVDVETQTSYDYDNSVFTYYVLKTEIALSPNTTYEYYAYDRYMKVGSETVVFETKDTTAESFTFAHVGDTQAYPTYFSDVLESVVDDVDFLVHTGDVVESSKYEADWTAMLDGNFEYLSRIPVQAISGNHETTYKNGSNETYKHFNYSIPEQTSTSKGLYYSFVYGNVKFIMLNTNDLTNSQLKAEQYNWLISELQNNTATWTIVAMHNPIYSAGGYGSNPEKNSITLALREQLQGIFAQYGVDIVLQGHDHTVSRTYPIDENGVVQSENNETINGVEYTVDPNGVIYVMSGTAGGQTRSPYDTDETLYEYALSSKARTWTEFAVDGNTIEITVKYYDGAKEVEMVKWGITKS